MPDNNRASSIRINAGQDKGILNPFGLGSMYEWESNEMNGTWAEMAMERNYEMETVMMYNPPLYDHFSDKTLRRSKWSEAPFGNSPAGSYQVSESNLIITGSSLGNYGLSTPLFQDTKWNDLTVTAELTEYTGNVFFSLFSGDTSSYENYIEVGINNGELVVRYPNSELSGERVERKVAQDIVLPLTFRIKAGHITDNGRTFTIQINDETPLIAEGLKQIGTEFKALLYCEQNALSCWDFVTVFHDILYDGFDSNSSRFLAKAYNGGSGTMKTGFGTMTIESSSSGEYGGLSERLRNTAVNWSEISVILQKVNGNAMLTLTGDEEWKNYIRFGVEDGVYKVFTSSGDGDRTIEKPVTLPAVLQIQVQPYYSNGRNFRFFVDGEIVHYIAESKDLPAPDYRMYLSSSGTGSSSTWGKTEISQEHFIDPAGPHFEGVSLPGDFAEASMNGGAYGTLNVYGSFLDLYGVPDSKYGVLLMPFNNSDIKPYKCYAKLLQCEGNSGMLYLTTQRTKGEYSEFVEFGVVKGRLAVRTEKLSWQGPQVTLPAVLEIYVSPDGADSRNLSFVCNRQPVYYLEHDTSLKPRDFLVGVYGDGDTHTQWDYAGGYAYEAWTEDGYDGSAVYSLDDSSAISGFYSMCMNILENNGKKGISQPALSVVEGHEYRFSAWLKKEGTIDAVHIQIGPNEADGPAYVPYGELLISEISGEFTKYSGSILCKATDINAKLSVLSEGTGTLWIDQISLMPTHESEVTPEGFRRDFIDKLIALNPVNLRWPGGIIADWYHFQDGIGADRDKRPPMYFAQWNASWLNNDVGIDEFLSLCKVLNIDPTLNVNFGTGTPEEAAKFVEYVNGNADTIMGRKREQNGRAEPYHIRFWEVGNETWGSWTPGHTDAVTFATMLLDYISAMRTADPTIRIIAEGADGNSYLQGWNIAVMGIAGNQIDELSTHYYSPQALPPDFSDEELYWVSVGSPQSVEERLRLSMNIATVTGKDVKYAITEYNAMYFNSPLRRTRTMEAALQAGGLLHAFFRYPGATAHNNYSCLANFWDGSSMHTGQRGIFVIPSYYVLFQLSNKRGQMLLESSTVSDTFNTKRQIGNTPPLTDVPYLDVLATRSLDGAKLYIGILNRDKEESKTIPLSLEGLTAVNKTAAAYIVSSGNYLDTNSFLEPTAVTMETEIIDYAGLEFSYTVPPLSYTTLELDISGLDPILTPLLCGIVVDANNLGIPKASISINGVNSGETDTNGYYEIPCKTGEYTIEVSKEGYFNASMTSGYLYGNGVTCQPIRLLKEGVLTDGAQITIASAASGKMVSLAAPTMDENAEIVQKTADGSDTQKWVVHSLADGSFYFTNGYSGKALSILDGSFYEGGRIVQRSYEEAADQHWIAELLENNYRLTNRKNSLCLDLPSSSSEEGLYLQTWYDNGAAAQRWSITE